MKCTQCGFESQQDFRFCPTCGTEQVPVAESEPIPEATADIPVVDAVVVDAPVANTADTPAGRVLAALKDSLFFLICILMTGAAALNLLAGSVPVLEILFSIFLWLTYAQAKKGIADKRQLRNLSGTVYAEYVVVNVSAIILAISGLLVATVGGFAPAMMEILEDSGIVEGYLTADVMGIMGSAFFIVIGVALLIGAAVAMVLNILSTRNIHRFAKSVYRCVEDESVTPVNAKISATWLLVMGIITAISAFGSFSTDFVIAVASGCDAAACLLAYALIRRYFPEG